MAIAMARAGGIGVIHRFLPIEQQVAEVAAREARREPRDRRAVHDRRRRRTVARGLGADGPPRGHQPAAWSTPTGASSASSPRATCCSREDPATARRRSHDAAASAWSRRPPARRSRRRRRILHEHRLEKLPLVDDDGRLRGLITVRDLLRCASARTPPRTPRAGCCVGAAIGVVGDYMERAEALRGGRRRRAGARHRPRPRRARAGGAASGSERRFARRRSWSPATSPPPRAPRDLSPAGRGRRQGRRRAGLRPAPPASWPASASRSSRPCSTCVAAGAGARRARHRRRRHPRARATWPRRSRPAPRR